MVSISPSPAISRTVAKPAAIRPAFSAVEPLNSAYYTQHFGFFCRKELLFEKATKIPLRFRLGSLEQCNALEGK